MYEEGKNKHLSFNWGALIIKLLVIIVVVFLLGLLIYKLTNKNDTYKISDEVFKANITTMKETAFEYFTSSKLPQKSGQSEKVTLSQLIKQKSLIDFTDDGKTCNVNDSYIEATKTDDGNYALKVSLTCGDKSDFIITSIEPNNCNNTNCNINKKEDNKEENKQVVNKNEKKDTTTSVNKGSSSSVSSNSSSKKTTTTTTITTTTKFKVKVTCSALCCGVSCENNNNNNTSTIKTRYYKHEKWTDWTNGYSNETGAENKKYTNTTVDYCPNVTNTYYSTSQVVMNSEASKYSYELQLIDLLPNKVDNVKLTSASYFSSTSDYDKYLSVKQKNLYEVSSGTKTAYVYPSTTALLMKTSLKESNFKFNVTNIYQNNNAYKTTVNINYLNGNDVTGYYAANIKECVYFVPIKFNVSYTDKTNCITDTEENSYKYTNYEKYNKQTNTYYKHRVKEYTWSTEKSIDGWTYTGIYEDR